MERRLVVWVDHGACVGNGTCLTIAPRVFVHNADRQSEVANPGGDPASAILRAAENCPVSAIHVEDAVSGERLFP
jgi:ferredoxin